MKKTKKQVISGYHRPVCTKCCCELHPEIDGVGVLDRADGVDYELFNADLWKCPKCGMEVVGGFGSHPISTHYEPDFQKHLARYQEKGILIHNNG